MTNICFNLSNCMLYCMPYVLLTTKCLQPLTHLQARVCAAVQLTRVLQVEIQEGDFLVKHRQQTANGLLARKTHLLPQMNLLLRHLPGTRTVNTIHSTTWQTFKLLTGKHLYCLNHLIYDIPFRICPQKMHFYSVVSNPG